MSVPGDFFQDGRFVPTKLVDYITSDIGGYHLITPTTERGGDTVWRYHEALGVFKPDGTSFIKKIAEETLGKRAKIGYVNETLEIVKIRTYTNPEDFEEKPGLVILQNGVYHLDTGELTDHSPLHFAKAAMPINYDLDATCPEILKFLGEVIPDVVTTFQEWIGYHLYKDMIYHKAAMFIGDGANGKSTLQDVMNAFLGYNNISQVSLYNLISNRFATSELYLKLANISPEITNDELKRTGTFKALTGHDRIRAEKKYRDSFSFTNYAKLTFLCNQLPTTPDMTRAFFRRWLIFVFPEKFEGVNCDPKILEKLTTPEELSGLFNWALEGLRRLKSSGRFTKSLSSDELQVLYESMSDPITAFIETYIIVSTSGAELKDDVYRAYYNFCRERGYIAVTFRTFNSDFKPRIAGLGDSTRKIKGRRGRCWVGLRLGGVTQNTLDTQDPKPVRFNGDYLGVTLDTLDTHSTLTSGGNSGEVSIDTVFSVSSVTPNASRDVKSAPPSPEPLLFQEARGVLEANDGKMDQTAFFQALTRLGYHQMQASEMLRADPRFAFRGMTVKLVGDETS